MKRGDLAYLLFLPCALAGSSVAVGAAAGERATLLGHVALAVLGAAGGGLCRLGTGAAQRIENVTDARRTVALGWLLLSVLGGVPFFVAAWVSDAGGPAWVQDFRDPWCALFEGVSGLTSTGLSVATQPHELPASLQWWRSLMEWVGGIGIVLLLLALVVESDDRGRGTRAMHRAEFGPTFRQRATRASRQVLLAYLPLTAATVVLFGLVGVPWWQAVNHGMTAISTGGFTITADGFASHGGLVQAVTLAPMVVGATGFPLLLRVLRIGDGRRLRRDPALWLYLGALLMATALAFATTEGSDDVLPAVFDAVSAVTTTGFSAGSAMLATTGTIALLAAAMLVGGMESSTAGGLKVDRLVRLGHGLVRRDRGAGDSADRPKPTRAGRLALAWLLILAIATGLLHLGLPGDRAVLDSLFECCSALSTVGLSRGIVGPELAWHGKLVLVSLMWLGRLEVLPVLLLFFVGARRAGRQAAGE